MASPDVVECAGVGSDPLADRLGGMVAAKEGLNVCKSWLAVNGMSLIFVLVVVDVVDGCWLYVALLLCST
jgi:hypothetical protein